MTNADERLAALWAMDAPPARDPVFEAALALRIERRRWLRSAVDTALLAVAGLVAVWAAWPFLVSGLGWAGPMLTIAVTFGLAVWSFDRTLEHWVFGGYEDFTRDLASE
jgi:hypothetical protein